MGKDGQMTDAKTEYMSLEEPKIKLIKALIVSGSEESMIAMASEVNEEVVRLIAIEIDKETEWTPEKIS